MNTVARRFLKKVIIKEVKWKTAAGSRDAALTGVAAGSIWMVKSSLLGVASQVVKMKQMPMMHVAPVFGQNILQTEFFCILTLRPGYAIVAGIKILKRWRGTRAKLYSTPLRLLTKG
nr:DUF2953 domain-containing protein [Bacillus ectoiniformans]